MLTKKIRAYILNKDMRKRGFTMIELLVSVTILGILTSMVAINVNGSLRKARDSKRKEALRQIVQGLNLYYNVNGMYPSSVNTPWPPTFVSGTNPPTQNNISGCGSLNDPVPADCPWGEPWAQDGVTYMQLLPKDPQNKPLYYRRASGGRLNYWLMAELERSEDTDINQSHINCDDSENGYILLNQYPNVYVVCDAR